MHEAAAGLEPATSKPFRAQQHTNLPTPLMRPDDSTGGPGNESGPRLQRREFHRLAAARLDAVAATGRAAEFAVTLYSVGVLAECLVADGHDRHEVAGPREDFVEVGLPRVPREDFVEVGLPRGARVVGLAAAMGRVAGYGT